MPENEPTPRDRAADDAAWQDLVRRLEESDGPADPPAATDGMAPTLGAGPGGHAGPARDGGRSGRGDHPGSYGGSVPTHHDDAAGASRGPRMPGADGSRWPDGGRTTESAGGGHAGAAPEGGPRDYSPHEDPDDGAFVPEDPPQLGAGEPLNVLAWCCVVGAPIALLLITMFWRSAPSLAWIGLCVAFLASAAYLIWRMPRQRPEGDDGARV
jgi:hypothetical protein